ncbi:MAG: hypothetical protein ACTHK7_21340 [Aureliella sp.]
MLRSVYLATCVLIYVSFFTEAARAEDPVLFTQWEVAREIVLNSPLARSLEITAAQHEQLEELLEDPEIQAQLRTTRRQLQRQLRDLDVEELLHLASAELDDLISAKLATILSPGQLADARRSMIRQRYPSAVAPFLDIDLLMKCGTSRKEAEALKPKAEAAAGKLVQAVAKLGTDSAARVLALLPPESQQLFVNYAGNKHFPGIEPEPMPDVDALPYSTFVRKGSLFALDRGPEGVNPLGLTDGQRQALARVEAQYQENARAATSGSPADIRRRSAEIVQRFDELSTNRANAVRSILTQTQLVKLYRTQALSGFESNPAEALSRAELLTYLRLSADQQAAITKLARQEMDSLTRERIALQQRTFEELCTHVGAEPRAALQRLFEDVWRP